MTADHSNRIHTPEVASYLGLYRRMKNAAKKRSVAWELPYDIWIALVSEDCYWCGVKPSTPYNSRFSLSGYTQLRMEKDSPFVGWILYNGIDRIDNYTPYFATNCRSCCKWCNFARNQRTDSEFLIWIERIARHALGGTFGHTWPSP